MKYVIIIQRKRDVEIYQNWLCSYRHPRTRSSASLEDPPCPRLVLPSVFLASSWRLPWGRSDFRYPVPGPEALADSPVGRSSCWWARRCWVPNLASSLDRRFSEWERPPGRSPPARPSPVDCGSPGGCSDSGWPCVRWTGQFLRGGRTPCSPRIGRCLGTWYFVRFPL